ncbi:17214_t:CDS:2, partial [Cetraspora pellucida]
CIRYATNKYYKLNPNLIQDESQASFSTKSQTQSKFDNEEFDPNQISIYQATSIAESTSTTEAFENLLVRSASS